MFREQLFLEFRNGLITQNIIFHKENVPSHLNVRIFRFKCLFLYLFVICINVLSRLIDKAAEEKRIGYHPKYKSIQITHLCFTDDLMVFVDGNKKSIEETIKIFDAFAVRSGKDNPRKINNILGWDYRHKSRGNHGKFSL